MSKHSRKHIRKSIRKYNAKGGNFLNAIGSVVKTRKNYTTPLTSITKVLNSASIEKRFMQSSNQLFQITYNSNTPNQLNININRTKPIPSSIVEIEPHIVIGNMNRYLIVLVDDAPFNKLLWVAEFANNTKKKTILSYQSPIPIGREKHSYAIKIYLYPNTIQPFSVLDVNTQKRNTEYTNLTTYLSNPQNATQIKLIMSFPLNIYKDTSNGINLFTLLNKTSKKQHNYSKLGTHIS